MSSTPRITTLILQSYYPTVRDLRSYLLEVLEPPTTSSGFPLLATDSEHFKAFISGTQVALMRRSVSLPGRGGSRLKVEEPMVHMRDIIDRAQEKLMCKKKAPNIITAGYRSAYDKGNHRKPGMARLGVSNYFVNTIVTALQGPEWERLLKRQAYTHSFVLQTPSDNS
ncbi:hypothetical protein HETIRDRAFT_450818 [Heterobasidion irregulare TC 32-1]|uniref:Uncharacterized protein n=1 Tax=Heterobasidion irregulare (strain TC 32-1) TaxID=747525 RepID=W4KBD5_HETIT|nr:uncharacterized protein HETIRDRAFT_450818 [Heterobasidion irregulare TC 32-1]ETW83157.1 hypothetical protein HETIRDRAFT_450818 [Heterobasidion irregulare TC 32-1]